MFIGHIPAGYLITKGVLEVSETEASHNTVLLVGIVAGMLPDFDIPYFYLIDNRQHLHHSYWIHIPIYWAGIFGAWFLLSRIFGKPRFGIYGTVISLNVFAHLVLDTLVGKIRWLYPFSDHDFYFFHVPAVYSWWVYNFVFHWSFLFEIALVVSAGWLLARNRAIKRPAVPN